MLLYSTAISQNSSICHSSADIALMFSDYQAQELYISDLN